MASPNSPLLSVARLGVNWRHDEDYAINRPGTGDFLFVHFTKPAKVWISEQPIHCQANTCILYTPDHHQHYCGDDCGLSNNWIHFIGGSAESLAQLHDIPLNEPFALAQAGFVPVLINEMRTEIHRKDPQYEAVVDLLLRQLFLLLRRNIELAARKRFTGRKAELAARFGELQAQVLGTLDHAWSVEEMARAVHLSRSRFMGLYREFFGTSPVEDLINARINHARFLLTATTLSVSQVAYECGFHSLYHFSRLFRKRVHCSPSEFATKFAQTTSLAWSPDRAMADRNHLPPGFEPGKRVRR